MVSRVFSTILDYYHLLITIVAFGSWNASRRTVGSRHSATMLPTTGTVCLHGSLDDTSKLLKLN
jgi:hypothetical protein